MLSPAGEVSGDIIRASQLPHRGKILMRVRDRHAAHQPAFLTSLQTFSCIQLNQRR